MAKYDEEIRQEWWVVQDDSAFSLTLRAVACGNVFLHDSTRHTA